MEKCFNFHQSSTRVVVEKTFGRYKGRFRRILLGMAMELKTICDALLCCCFLHNFLELLPCEVAVIEAVEIDVGFPSTPPSDLK